MRINSIEKFPKEEHFAALVFTSETVYTPGDERSRTHPGHGYPESYDTVRSVDYIHLGDESKMRAWVQSREDDKRNNRYSTKDEPYQIIKVKPVKLQTSIAVQIL